jgi:hypothetical protein
MTWVGNSTRAVLVLTLGLAVVVSCGALQDRGAAEAAVDRFHVLFNEASDSVIYNEADPELRRSMTVPAFAVLLRSMHRDLGIFKQARRTGLDAEKEKVSLVYDSEFERGRATERFTYTIRQAKAYLVAYEVTSPVLIVR